MVKGKKPAGLDAESKQLLEALGAEIVAHLGDQFFQVDGTPMATVKYADGTFKKKPLLSSWEFKPEYAYVGTRGTLNFGFSSEDEQEYQFVEMNLKEIDNSFPMVGPAVATAFGIEGEKLPFIIETIMHKRLTEAYEQRLAEQARAENAYQNNDAFGAF